MAASTDPTLTLPALLDAAAAHAPDAPCITDETGTLTWRGFVGRVAALAAQLARVGIGSEDRVAVWLPNSADYLALCFALARRGALAVHLNTRFRDAELGALLARARPVALVTEWGFAPVDFPAILAALPADARASLRLVLGRNVPAGVDALVGHPVEALARQGTATPDLSDPERPCLTYTTSGTTSGPKLVMHRQRSIARHAQDIARHTGMQGGTLLAAIPFCGTFGNAGAMAMLAAAGHVVAMARFDAPAADRLIRQHGVTHSFGGDDMLARLVDAAAGRRHTTMRCFGYAAFHSTAMDSARAAEAIGLMPTGVYGSSEVQALFSLSREPDRAAPGGVPVSADTELSVRDPDSGAVLAPGESGELCVRAPSMFAQYLENPDATARAKTTDGFFRSGDLARLTADGFVYEARIGDALRLGGFLVNPEEIEGFLQQQPGIAGVQVVGASANGDPVPVAFVLLDNAADFDERALIDMCRTHLARYKVPARIAAVTEFPVTPSANGPKIQRVRLRERAVALLERR